MQDNMSSARFDRVGSGITTWIFELLFLMGRRKRRVVWLVGTATVLSVIAAFVVPSIYEANTKILLPQQSASIASMFSGASLASLAGAPRDLSSALKSPTDIYVSMLESRSVADAIIDRFDLMHVYKSRRRMDCRKTLAGNVIINTEKGNIITITVRDRDPNRAAEIANGFVDELSRLNQDLAITEAKARRQFFEQQLRTEQDALIEAETRMVRTQQSTKLIAPESQTKVTVEGIGKLKEQIGTLEGQLQAARLYGTERNANVLRLEAELAGLREQLVHLVKQDQGQEGLIATSKIPEAAIDYVRRARELKYHESVMELLLRQFEAAKLDEAREGATIQVLDRAIAPEFRTSPHRKVMVLIAMFAAMVLSVFWAFSEEAWTRAMAHPRLAKEIDVLLGIWFGTYWERLRTRFLARRDIKETV